MHLEEAPRPAQGTVLQLRAGKIRVKALGGEQDSAIYKKQLEGPVQCTATGLLGDEHHSSMHGGTERAVHQYNPDHYADWAAEERCPAPELYEAGAYGENLVCTGTAMSEDNVCIGDVYRVGSTVLLEVSEPRHPCHKLNARFRWPRALGRTIRTARSGWNMRVLQTGVVQAGDAIELVRRPHPRWSVLNVQRVIRGRHVSLDLLAECAQLPMTDLFLDLAKDRLRKAPKTYILADAKLITSRVRQVTFELKDKHLSLSGAAAFEPYSYAQISVGPSLDKDNHVASSSVSSSRKFDRSYSIVDGDIERFTLGVALDVHSRGGSAYIHQELQVGDEIEMAPGTNPAALENDRLCEGKDEGQGDHIAAKNLHRVVIAGGIGITAFIPSVRDWEARGLQYHVHYAVRSRGDAAFLDWIPQGKVTVYASAEGNRLDLESIVPEYASVDDADIKSVQKNRIFCCGPSRMMSACANITTARRYPEHMVHFEDFGTGTGGGDLVGAEPFDVEVDDPETGRSGVKLSVPASKTLLDVLLDAGFDIVSSCRFGGCGACRVGVGQGSGDRVVYNSSALMARDKGKALQACVDRGRGTLGLVLD